MSGASLGPAADVSNRTSTKHDYSSIAYKGIFYDKDDNVKLFDDKSKYYSIKLISGFLLVYLILIRNLNILTWFDT